MDSLPTVLAVGALVLGAACLLLTRSARRRADPGDFERRLDDMRTGRGFSGSDGAALGRAARPVPGPDLRPHDLGPERTLAPPPTLEEYAAPPAPDRLYEDPDLGEFTYDPEDQLWQQDHEDGPVPWFHIEAGPDGPTEVQRRCVSKFLDDEDGILDRAFDGLFRTVGTRGLARPVMEVASLYVERVAPEQVFARGTINFRFDGFQGLPASASTTDDWATLACDVDSSPREKN